MGRVKGGYAGRSVLKGKEGREGWRWITPCLSCFMKKQEDAIIDRSYWTKNFARCEPLSSSDCGHMGTSGVASQERS
jgi:hypothetical protein